MSVALASVEKINALKTGIEATTGESYNDLTEAVQALKNGYKNADTVDGWNVNVLSDGSDPENITKPTLTFVYTAGG